MRCRSYYFWHECQLCINYSGKCWKYIFLYLTVTKLNNFLLINYITNSHLMQKFLLSQKSLFYKKLKQLRNSSFATCSIIHFQSWNLIMSSRFINCIEQKKLIFFLIIKMQFWCKRFVAWKGNFKLYFAIWLKGLPLMHVIIKVLQLVLRKLNVLTMNRTHNQRQVKDTPTKCARLQIIFNSLQTLKYWFLPYYFCAISTKVIHIVPSTSNNIWILK